MSTLAPNQLSYWYSGQIVTAEQMTAFSEDIYDRFTSLTDTQGYAANGCILSLASFEQTGSDVAIGNGSFRFPATTLGYLGYTPGIIGNVEAATVGSVTGDGFIVARYTVDPTTPTETNYVFTVTYEFVASVDATTDCLIATVTSGTADVTDGSVFYNCPGINNNYITGQIDVNSGTSNFNVTGHQSAFTHDSTLRPIIQNAVGLTSLVPLAVAVGADFNSNNLDSSAGHQILPGGLVLQWGTQSCTSDPQTFTFDIAFPNACFGVVVTPVGGTHSAGVDAGFLVTTNNLTTTTFDLYNLNPTIDFTYWAWGN